MAIHALNWQMPTTCALGFIDYTLAKDSECNMTNYRSIVVLTGAGISAESGIPTFRASDGLWENHPVEEIATPEGFERDRLRVHRFYNARREKAMSTLPNQGHLALARLEAEFDGNFLLITQNIDTLHEQAGSQNLIHMHGQIDKMKCFACAHDWKHIGASAVEDLCPNCGQMTTRPDIVWFGEMPYQMEECWEALAQCDLFVAIGTSGNVYPAAGFAQVAARAGAYCIEINLEPSQNARDFDDGLYGKAGDLLPAFVDDILG